DEPGEEALDRARRERQRDLSDREVEQRARLGLDELAETLAVALVHLAHARAELLVLRDVDVDLLRERFRLLLGEALLLHERGESVGRRRFAVDYRQDQRPRTGAEVDAREREALALECRLERQRERGEFVLEVALELRPSRLHRVGLERGHELVAQV